MSLAIVILTKSNLEMLFQCLTSIKRFTTCSYKIYLGDTGSTDLEKDKIRNVLKVQFPNQFELIEFDYYHYAKCTNTIVRDYVKESLLLFLNNDVVFENDTIDTMYHTFLQIKRMEHQIGTLGCRLIYPDGTIQHDGQFVSRLSQTDFAIGHINLHRPQTSIQSKDVQGVIGNTFACCMTEYHTFIEMGMLNESYKYCFEDVEYNLACVNSGLHNLILPSKYYAIHHESYTRKQQPEYFAKEDYLLIRDYLNKALKENK